jgi:hypothetical protein
LKEANNFPLEFEELPRLQQLVSLGKVPCTLIFLFVQVFVHTSFPILRMLNFDTAILVNIHEQQDKWASSHALGCCRCHVEETAASNLKLVIFLFVCRRGQSV